MSAEVLNFAFTGQFSRRFDFGTMFSQDDLQSKVFYKVINKAKNTEFIGTLDKDGLSPRIYGNSADHVSISILGVGNLDKWQLQEVSLENRLSSDISQEDTCCAENEHDHSQGIQNDSIESDSALDDDFQNFDQ